jgi:penicillin G amidase
MKRLRLALLGLIALIIVLALGTLVYVRSSSPNYSATRTLAGLEADVEVWRDSLGVPHLWARSEADLFRALGFVHAQDRLFQMEMFRRVADGRLAEILGPDLVESDRFLRTVGLGRAAGESERLLTAEERMLLEAYADGVNGWLRTRWRALPPEFLALRFRPEPWTVRNTLSIARIMGWDLADWEDPLEFQRAVDIVGPELAAELRPPYPDWGDRILPNGARWNAARALPGRSRTGVDTVAALIGVPLPRVPEPARALIEGASIAHASNSWVIGGEHTRSGRPILANDMHLALRAPAIWYLAALHGGGIEAAGMTIPGVPGIVAGHSRRVAWGFTNAQVADVDFFVEQVDSLDPGLYLTPSGWSRFEVRQETIRVRGGDDVVHTVRTTRSGPVVSDVETRAGGRVLSMRWTALEPSSEVGALLAMNRAADADAFLEAVRGFTSPHQNVVFADADGAYGYRLAGRIPVRARGDGRLPAPGWTGEYDWVRFLEPDEHPELVHRPGDTGGGGYIVTANNQQLRPGDAVDAYPFQIGRRWAEPFRAMRIREMIEAGDAFTADDVARQQMDRTDLFAARYVQHAVRAAEAAGLAAEADTLRAWTAEALPESRAAALFYVWYEGLRRRVGEVGFADRSVFLPRAALNRMLDGEGGGWLAGPEPGASRSIDELAAAAMRDAAREVRGRSWGDLHQTAIRHPLGSARALDRALGLNLEPMPRGGSSYTVDVAPHGIRPPFTSTFGASQRHVVDMGDPDHGGGFIVPTGQSGIPFSAHYADQARLWRDGVLWPIPLDRERARARIVHQTRLRPGTI